MDFTYAFFGLKIFNPPYWDQHFLSSEYGHVVYQTLCDRPTKILVKKSSLYDLSRLRKDKKNVAKMLYHWKSATMQHTGG